MKQPFPRFLAACGWRDWDEYQRAGHIGRVHGWVKDANPSTAVSMASKYRPKRNPKEEYEHQKSMLAEAVTEFDKLDTRCPGGKLWKRAKIRVSVIRRLKQLAKEKLV